MILDEKSMHPPPPRYSYSQSHFYPSVPSSSTTSEPPPSFSEVAATSTWSIAQGRSSISTLPAHLLLQIVFSTFPLTDGKYEGESRVERQRENLYYLETSLRLVDRRFYAACMHILRSTYLPTYEKMIYQGWGGRARRGVYSCDPFPSNGGGVGGHRELATLDLFIALLAHEDLMLDSTELHLPREEAYKDLFDYIQPRSRLEDLVREEGVKIGVVWYGEGPAPTRSIDTRAHVGLGTDSVEESHSPATSLPQINAQNQPQIQVQSGSSASPTRYSFNPFSKSSYISLAKSKLRRGSEASPSPPASPIFPSSPTVNSTDCKPSTSEARPSTSTPATVTITPLPFSSLTVSFSPRTIKLIYTPPSSSNGMSGTNVINAYHGSAYGALSLSVTGPTGKALVEITRERDETLEESAKRLVEGLLAYLVERS